MRTIGLALCLVAGGTAASQSIRPDVPLGQLVDIGGYRLHLWCSGPSTPGRATVVMSSGGGDYAVDWSRVQIPLSDSARVCSYDRPGYGWSDPGPYSRTFKQEAVELRTALDLAGERSPYIIAGHSLGAFVARQFAQDFKQDVAGVVLVGPTNENGKLGFRGQFVLLRTLATDRPVPPAHSLAEAPPKRATGAEADSCVARADRTARIVRPYDQLRALAQRHRMWALTHPVCVETQDDYFAEQMAAFYREWQKYPHPLFDVPLVVVMGTRPEDRRPPPGLSEAEWRSDSLRIDLSLLSSRGRLVNDTLSGHHVQLDNPAIVIGVIREMLRETTKPR